MHRIAIHWYRRDLRISDQLSLLAARDNAERVVPCYLMSDWKGSHSWTGSKRQSFLCESLAELDRNLQSLGGRLIMRQGDAVTALRRLIQESGATALHAQADPDPFGKATEARVRKMCDELGVECILHHDATLHAPDEVLTQSGQPFRVFTPYSRRWLDLEKKRSVPLSKDLGTPDQLTSLPLPSVAHWGLQTEGAWLPGGETAARKRLDRAIEDRIANYAARRDFPALAGTSRLSQDLRFGLISIRTVFARCQEALAATRLPAARAGIETFIKELAWREFYFAILHHFPEVLDLEFTPAWRGLPWDEPGGQWDAWQHGRTGFPIVDAGIRELRATGHMHNRVRMIVAMFLTKDLHLDWRLGESFFMQHLVDGEIASNNGGWQWSAGTGADAAPYFRIQNPWSQTKRYDPDGAYIKRWLPELAHVAPAKFCEPPKNGAPLAHGYPAPIVDHAAERARTLAIFQRHKQQQG